MVKEQGMNNETDKKPIASINASIDAIGFDVERLTLADHVKINEWCDKWNIATQIDNNYKTMMGKGDL
jgi:hypothetical protein